MIPIDKLGLRIFIIGCSNSGKSTLADSLSKKLNIAVYHVDQYAHIESSNWQRQSDDILVAKHNEIIKHESWIIDGNYSVCMKQRFENATSIIWLDPSVVSSVYRYILRSFKNDPERPGRLEGAKKEFNWWLVKWIILNYPKNRLRYSELLQEYSNKLLVHIRSIRELNRYYSYWNL